MSKHSGFIAIVCALAVSALGTARVQAGAITQTVSLPLSATDFGPSVGSLAGNPLVVQQFNTEGGTRALDSVQLTFEGKIQSTFTMTFTTPATITASLASGNAAQPGPAITLFQPGGKTPILTDQVPNTSTALTRSVTYGLNAGQKLPQTFSSSLPSTSPFYIAPTMFDQSSSVTLTSAAALAAFTGKGTIALPVGASAVATLTSSSGNGQSQVTTQGAANLTVTYQFETVPQGEQIPEPQSFALWALAGAALVASRLYASKIS